MIEVPEKFSADLRESYPITWQEIFAVWRLGEAHSVQWQRHWVERDFNSWDQWRSDYVSELPVNVSELDWCAYEVLETKVFLDILGVPSRGWIEKCYGSLPPKKLGEILDHEIVRDNEKVIAIEKNFPHVTMITGLIVGDDVMLLEGMHRALAIARGVGKENPCFEGSQIVLALARVPGDTVEKLQTDTVLGRG